MSDNLIILDNVSLAFGLDILLDQVKLTVSPGERLCLIGRNGAGKSSLLRVMEGIQPPDSGNVWLKPNLKLARLHQELPQDLDITVYEFVSLGLADIGEQLAEYYHLTTKIAKEHTPKDLVQLAQLQQRIEAQHGWQLDQRIQSILTRLQLDPAQTLRELSGGWQRRAALAQTLVSQPQLLLLDEPTNHLDIEAIQWLENQLVNLDIALVFITHDRSLLQRVATRIIELDRGKLTSWPGDYNNFLRRKEEMLHAEANLNEEFDKKLAQEERWIRQGIKARRTRNEGRVRALKSMRVERSQRRELQGKVSFNVTEARRSGQLVVELDNVSYDYQQNHLIKNLSLRIMRGDRVGLIGPNGAGKSTLLKLLLGELNPTEGRVTLGTNLQIAYFDQLRENLDLEKNVIDNVAEGRSVIEIGDKKQHVMGYLTDFLFTPQRALTPVKALSGGECNRLLLARLFSRPVNLLVMDEPTNDLDIETLELLEELLVNYKGTLLLVSHDRTFIDNIVTSTLIFSGQGQVTESIGGYHDWLQQSKKIVTKAITKEPEEPKSQKPKKISYSQQQELKALPNLIEKMEEKIAQLQKGLSDPSFYQQSSDEITKAKKTLQETEAALEQAYLRWSELDKLA